MRRELGGGSWRSAARQPSSTVVRERLDGDDVDQRPRPLEVGQELVPEADALADAPSSSPGTSATVSWRPSSASTVPSEGASVVNG